MDGVIIVGIDNEYVLASSEGFRHPHGVGGASWLALNREMDAHACGGNCRVAIAHAPMLRRRTDHETHVGDAGVGQRAHRVIQKGATDGNQTFHAVVGDLVRSLLRGGFRRIVLVPTHGGNFAPLAAAVSKLDERQSVTALTDLGVLFQIAQMGEREYGVPLAEGGLHAGEWETSLLLAIHPDLVAMEHAEPGFTGDLQDALKGIFAEGGVAALSENGAIGDPRRATTEHGERYWSAAVDLALEQIEAAAREATTTRAPRHS